jgi:hypothetical protein
MKTRTLLLMALGCGLAIMLAGAVFLVQLTRQDEPETPLLVGAAATVGDMTVSVDEVSEVDGELTVTVTLNGAADESPADDFRLIASGRPAAVSETSCAMTAVDDAETCTVTFDVSAADGVSRVLFYERGEERARWLLG